METVWFHKGSVTVSRGLFARRKKRQRKKC